MKKIMKNWRYWLMVAVSLTAILNLVGMPQEENPNYWALVIYSKFTAIVLAYMDIRLYVWFAKHRKIDDIINFVNEDK